MNPLERKLVSVLKTVRKGLREGPQREKAGKDFLDLRTRVLDADFCQILDRLFADFSAPSAGYQKVEAAEAFRFIGELRERSFVEAASFLFLSWQDVIAKQTLEEVLPVAPDSTSLEAWRKAARVPLKEIEDRLLSNPVSSYASAGADWLLLHTKPEQTLPVLELFLGGKERPKTLRPWSEALVPALKKDKRGALLEWMLRHPWPDKEPLTRLGEVVRMNRTLLKNAVESLPAILCKKDAPERGAFLVEEIFALMPRTQGAEREFATALLARLGCGILVQDRRGPQAEAVLAVIAQVERRLRNLTKDEATQARTWVLENLSAGAEPSDGKIHVTIEGARRIAMAFEKAAEGFAAKDILTATARNLGLTPVGKKGDAVSYNPLQHEDLVGGMLPGDSAFIEEAGWALGQELVVRAKLKKGGSNV